MPRTHAGAHGSSDNIISFFGCDKNNVSRCLAQPDIVQIFFNPANFKVHPDARTAAQAVGSFCLRHLPFRCNAVVVYATHLRRT